MQNRIVATLGVVGILLGTAGVLPAESPGQKHLDEALKVKLTASNVVQLGQVIRLCDEALKAGLEKDDQEFCNTLLAGALVERGVSIGRTVLTGAAQGPLGPADVQQLVQLRAAALEDLERAVKLKPKAAEGYLMIGRLNALPGGDRTRAVTALSTAILLHPENPNELAQAYLTRAQLGDDAKQRLADYNAAVKISPKKATPLRARSVFHLEQNEPKKCLKDVDESLEIEPRDAQSYQIRGMALDTLKDYDKAITAYSKAIELASNPLSAYLGRARDYLRQDKGKEAIRDFNKILAQQEPTPGLLLLRASAYEVAGDRDLALEDVESALKLKPDMPQALRARAALRRHGQGRPGDRRLGDAGQGRQHRHAGVDTVGLPLLDEQASATAQSKPSPRP